LMIVGDDKLYMGVSGKRLLPTIPLQKDNVIINPAPSKTACHFSGYLMLSNSVT